MLRSLLLAAGAALFQGAPPATVSVTGVPAAVRSDFGIHHGWYARYVDAGGIPVLGSANVSDRALLAARNNALALLRTLPHPVAQTLREQRNRIVILAPGETVGNIPEFAAAFPDRSNDERFWGGFGATLSLPITAGTEANLVHGHNRENVFVHEFAHTVAELGLVRLDASFQPELEAAYAHARRTGRWANTYAGERIIEYWAEGVQSYFGVNREGPAGGDGVHNDINTRAELADYDPQLYALIRRVYGAQGLNLAAQRWPDD